MAKRVKVTRKKKRNLGRIIGTLSFVTTMIVIITLSALYQRKPEPIQKELEPADKYFIFSKAQAYADAKDETNSSIWISEVYFNITAVGGNANNVFIYPVRGLIRSEETPYFREIVQNQTKKVFITYSEKLLTVKKDEGYPLYFKIVCDEAEGNVILYVTEFFPTI
jgi:hypothetical protein